MKKKLTGIVLLLLFFAMPLQGQAKVKAPKKQCHAYAVMDAEHKGAFQAFPLLLANAEYTLCYMSDKLDTGILLQLAEDLIQTSY